MSETQLTTTQRILSEDLVTLQEATAELSKITGKKEQNRSTLYRWCRRGVRGTKLEYVVIGNCMFTSKPALARFIEARSA